MLLLRRVTKKSGRLQQQSFNLLVSIHERPDPTWHGVRLTIGGATTGWREGKISRRGWPSGLQALGRWDARPSPRGDTFLFGGGARLALVRSNRLLLRGWARQTREAPSQTLLPRAPLTPVSCPLPFRCPAHVKAGADPLPSFRPVAVDFGESESEDESPPAVAAPALPPTPSKKARKRQLLKQKSSVPALALDDTDSDVSSISPSAASVPPVPSLPFKQNGATRTPKADHGHPNGKGKDLPAAPKAPELEPTPKSLPPHAHVHSPRVDETPSDAIAHWVLGSPSPDDDDDDAKAEGAPGVPESIASSSDAEAEEHYSDEDDASDEDEPSLAPTPAALAPSPSASLTPSGSSSPGLAPTPEVYTGADHEPSKKIQSIITRTLYSLLMIAGFVGILSLGHVYVIMLVFACQAVVFSELTALFDAAPTSAHNGDSAPVSKEREQRRRGRKEERDRWSRRISWFALSLMQERRTGELTPAPQVLFCGHQLLPLRRKLDLLLQAHPHPPVELPPNDLLVRPTSPTSQLLSLRHWCVSSSLQTGD